MDAGVVSFNILSVHYRIILSPLHDGGINAFCVTWNRGVRRMLNVSIMTHTVLLGQIINTCQISIQLVKRFGKSVDLMLTSRNAIVRHVFKLSSITDWQKYSGQSAPVRNV